MANFIFSLVFVHFNIQVEHLNIAIIEGQLQKSEHYTPQAVAHRTVVFGESPWNGMQHHL